MLFRALDENGDWTFGKGLNCYLKDADAMSANIKTRLKTWKSECFVDTELGVDWQNYLGIGTKALLDVDIRRVTMSSDGVIRIDSYESVLDASSRQLTVDATIQTVFSTITLSEVF